MLPRITLGPGENQELWSRSLQEAFGVRARSAGSVLGIIILTGSWGVWCQRANVRRAAEERGGPAGKSALIRNSVKLDHTRVLFALNAVMSQLAIGHDLICVSVVNCGAWLTPEGIRVGSHPDVEWTTVPLCALGGGSAGGRCRRLTVGVTKSLGARVARRCVCHRSKGVGTAPPPGVRSPWVPYGLAREVLRRVAARAVGLTLERAPPARPAKDSGLTSAPQRQA